MTNLPFKTRSIENSFIERLARKVGIVANAKYIYGELAERDGGTILQEVSLIRGATYTLVLTVTSLFATSAGITEASEELPM
ncbi:MAG TPA: hypothetical protein VF596_22700 [Pyrinomonadaceae bacterium]|jgi:hypothetical protein